MRHSLSVLIVEDREHDAALLVRELRRSGFEPTYERVDNQATMVAALNKGTWDVVLADYSMPRFNAHSALTVLAKTGVDIPFIVVSGSVGEEIAVEVMRAGAQDLVLKHNLKRLPAVISRELEAAKTRRERRAADAKLDCERHLLNQLMQGIPDAICFKDLQRRYIRLNDAERANLNVASDEGIIGRTSDEFFPTEIAQKRRAEEERVLVTREPLVDCSEKIVSSAGVVRWLSATKAPIRGPDGDIVGIVEIARDITESKRQDQLKNEFIATVSHELRTPLTSITGAVGILAGGGAGRLPDQATRMLAIALGNCRRLVAIVNDILDMEKIDLGKMSFDRKRIALLPLIEQVIQANQAMAIQHDVTLRLSHDSVPCSVLADSDRLTQVIANLISNAIKFSPTNAEVVLGVDRLADFARITVRDHGPGIPDDYKDRIFDKFVQVEATDQRKRGGTGLGLSIAKQIVTQLDGAIGFDAAPGGGTIFKVEFKALDSEPSAPGPVDEKCPFREFHPTGIGLGVECG